MRKKRVVARCASSRTYRTTYPQRLMRSARTARLAEMGIITCPHCGSEAVHVREHIVAGEVTVRAICMHCGFSWLADNGRTESSASE